MIEPQRYNKLGKQQRLYDTQMKEKVILVKGRNIACPTLNSNFHPTSIIA
jgi:hypothetical protein